MFSASLLSTLTDEKLAPFLCSGRICLHDHDLLLDLFEFGFLQFFCLSRVDHRSKTDIRSITKISRRIPHDMCYVAHQFQVQKVKGQGHRPTNADTQNEPYLPNSKAQELQSWCADGGRRCASAASAMTSKEHTVSAEPGGHTSCSFIHSFKLDHKIYIRKHIFIPTTQSRKAMYF